MPPIHQTSENRNRASRTPASHQLTPNTTENGTNVSLASAPRQPNGKRSHHRFESNVHVTPARQKASHESTIPARFSFTVEKLSRYRVAANRDPARSPVRPYPIENSNHAEVATNIELDIRSPKKTGSHVLTRPFAR